jgi:assimilatory nitrate reductase catalytic subunit
MSGLQRIPTINSGSSHGLESNALASSTLKQSTCPYCGVGCGVDVQLSGSVGQPQPVAVSGTPEHPANFGRLCIKGSKLLDTLEQNQRLVTPQVDGLDASWEQAAHEVAHRFSKIIKEHGPNSVALYVSGQLLTEDYYVANKLMKGYIGSANIDTNSRLCMSSAVAAQKRAFGSDAVPCSYEDLELSELIVFVGSNAAWTHPVLFQRVERAKQLNPGLKVVIIDPRNTATCELGDLHLPIKAGTDVALFNGLLNYLSENGGLDSRFLESSVAGFDNALKQAREWTVERTAQVCDLAADQLEQFYTWFCASQTAMSFYSMGVNQSSSGVDKANSIINCHLASGKIGKPGSAPFSITGQPNAMGGREVGGLSNLLAAHMDIDNEQHRDIVQEYWNSPTLSEQAGHKAVELFDAIESGEVKAVWIMATNPLVSMPNRNRIERALKKCACVVVSDYVASNDTLAYADIKLPATAWSEKDGTVTNSDRTISRQRAFLPALGEARHDWKIICDVAQRMGYSGFDFQSSHEVFVEYAGLTGYRNGRGENESQRDLDLSGLAQLSSAQFDRMKPVQWPVNSTNPNGTKRLFTDQAFYTPTGKANCIAVDFKIPTQVTSDAYPFVLNSGRLRDQWHTMTRSGSSSALSQHSPESFLAIHAEDAQALDLKDGDLVSLSSAVSTQTSQQVVLPIQIDSAQRRGELFAPIHWGKQWSSSASIAYLYSDARDAISGQPELKHAAVALEKLTVKKHAYLLLREELDHRVLSTMADVWSKIRINGAFVYRISCLESTTEIAQQLADLGVMSSTQSMSHTKATGRVSLYLNQGALSALLMEQSSPLDFHRAWFESLIQENALSSEQIHELLHGEVDDEFTQGKIVCSCFKVGEKAIHDAIETKQCDSVESLGDALKCGTNCGSCKPELKKILAKRDVKTVSLQPEEVLV